MRCHQTIVKKGRMVTTAQKTTVSLLKTDNRETGIGQCIDAFVKTGMGVISAEQIELPPAGAASRETRDSVLAQLLS